MKPAQPACGIWFVLMLFAATSIAGCGGKVTYPVAGEVVYKDGSNVSALAGGLVIFDSADPDQPKMSARGKIGPDGTFRMSSHWDEDGVPAGKYRIQLTQPVFYRKSDDEERPVLFDERYKRFDTSGLEITVTGPITDYKITLQKP